MEQYISLMKNTDMFTGIDENEIPIVLKCLNAYIKRFMKNEYIFRSGEYVHSIGMVLSGQILIEREDFWGKRIIIQEITPGYVFGESYACLAKLPADITAVASMESEIIFFNLEHLLNTYTCGCRFHARIIQNLLGIMARKNINLYKKIDYMSKKTIREKLLAYLYAEYLKTGNASFSIPFNRQELADYLSVDRSALSHEISKLQKEGVIRSSKKKFLIIRNRDKGL